MKVVIIQYNAGNIRSVSFALERLGIQPIISGDPEVISSADKVIFPGVGEAQTTMRYLKATKLDQLIKRLRQPVLGICLGMQLLCKYSEENNTECLNIFPIEVKRFIPVNREKVPHIGWNAIYNTSQWVSAPFRQQYMYFVHSYYVPVSEYSAAECHYIHPFSAVLQKDNFFATQFHPEKSGSIGEKLLQVFLNIS